MLGYVAELSSFLYLNSCKLPLKTIKFSPVSYHLQSSSSAESKYHLLRKTNSWVLGIQPVCISCTQYLARPTLQSFQFLVSLFSHSHVTRKSSLASLTRFSYPSVRSQSLQPASISLPIHPLTTLLPSSFPLQCQVYHARHLSQQMLKPLNVLIVWFGLVTGLIRTQHIIALFLKNSKPFENQSQSVATSFRTVIYYIPM